MRKSSRVISFALGLMLVVVACSVPGGDTQIAETVREQLTPTDVAKTQIVATSTGSMPVASTLPEEALTQTPTARREDTPNGTETPQLETSGVTVEVGADQIVSDETQTGRAPTDKQARLLASLQDFGPAPELTNESWLNSEPLKLADLRGKVVMVEFWTFG